MRFLKLLLAVATLAGVALLADRIFPSEEGEVKDLVVAVARALGNGDLPTIEAALEEDFRFDSADRAVGSGDRASALARARQVSENGMRLRIRVRRIRAEVEGDAAKVEGYGEAWAGRRHWAGREYDFQVELRRGPDGAWRLAQARIEPQAGAGGPAEIARSLVDAAIEGNLAAVEGLLAPTLQYKSSDPAIGSGDRDEALDRFREWRATVRSLEFEEDPEETRDEIYPFHGWVRMEGTLSGVDGEGQTWSRPLELQFDLFSEGGAARVTEVEIELP